MKLVMISILRLGSWNPGSGKTHAVLLGDKILYLFTLKLTIVYIKAEGKEWEKVSSSLRQIFSSKTGHEWFEFLKEKDIAVGKVYSMDETFADPQVLHRKMVIEVDHCAEDRVRQVGNAIKLSKTPGKVRTQPPILSKHSEEVLTALGYSKQKIAKLLRDEIVSYP